MEPDGAAEVVQAFVRSAADRARSDRALVASTPQDPELEALLRTAILERARVGARSALWAASMVAADREAARDGDRASRRLGLGSRQRARDARGGGRHEVGRPAAGPMGTDPDTRTMTGAG